MTRSFWITFFSPLAIAVLGLLCLAVSQEAAISLLILSLVAGIGCGIGCGSMAAFRLSDDSLVRVGIFLLFTGGIWCLYGGVAFGGCVAAFNQGSFH